MQKNRKDGTIKPDITKRQKLLARHQLTQLAAEELQAVLAAKTELLGDENTYNDSVR